MDLATAIATFATLFVVIDPIGLTPIFVALTVGQSAKRRRAIAARGCLLAFGIILLFGLFGNAVLEGMGISLPAFRIAGGIFLFALAFEMLFERRTQRREGRTADAEDNRDPSVFPLATPLIAGPGTLAAVILITTAPGATWLSILEAHLIAAGVVLICFVLFNASGLIERVLGHTGILVVTRLMGMLLGALSVQFIVDGLAGIGLIASQG